ncbi:MAG: riboflavin synthase [Desulfarculus sp.]|nr:riboflavin synthase [Desulfarculus sp.]
MFTGLIEGLGRIARITSQGPDAVLVVAPPWPLVEAVLGESVAVSGACLTVTGTSGQGFSLDVSAESLFRTTLGRLRPGDSVNLERALKLGERLGGHLVTGHVDCVGTIARIQRVGGSVRITIAIPAEHLRYVVEKGSVAVDGISLTVNQVSAAGFDLNIIPHTLAATTLQLVKEGDSVNIETDLIGKYVARLLNRDANPEPAKGALSREDLARMGF